MSIQPSRSSGIKRLRPSLARHIKRMLALESAMSQALERAQFYLHYQPQLSIDGHRVVGVEALLRWHHPVLGHISPAEFIPLGMV